MDAVKYLGDKLQNLVANLGTDRDKASGTTYVSQVFTAQQLMTAYREAWLPRKIVDIPALDACRKWRNWQAEADQITALEEMERRHNLREKVKKALTLSRLFGRASLWIGTGDTELSLPLVPERIKREGLRYVTVLSPQELTPTELDQDPMSEYYGQPKGYRLSRGQGIIIHPSRLVTFIGNPIPDDFMSERPGEGDSVLQSVMEAVYRADGTDANIASLIFEAKVDVLSIPNLSKAMGDPKGPLALASRLTSAASMKGINGMMVIDSEESYQQKSASFSALPAIMDRFYQAVSGAADIPMTRLFGMSPAGMNSTGDGDLKNYYDRIQAIQELEIQPAMMILDEVVIRSALGARPEEIYYVWASLWQTDEKERAEIGKITSETLSSLANTNLINPDALAQAGANALIEQGVLPGLEAAIEEFGLEPEEDDEEDQLAAAQMLQQQQPVVPEEKQVTDAALPRPLYIRRDVLNAADILRHYRSQGWRELVDDAHVTILYSNQPVDWSEMGRDWMEDKDGRVRINPGGYREHEVFGEVTVLRFDGSNLKWRHEELIDRGASHDWPDYSPHVTLGSATDLTGNVEPWRGPIVLGPEIFEEIKP